MWFSQDYEDFPHSSEFALRSLMTCNLKTYSRFILHSAMVFPS